MHQLSLTSRRRMISLAAAFIAVAMLSGCGAAPPTSPVIDPTSVSGATRLAAASDARRDGGLDNPAGGDTGVSQPGTNPDGTTTGNVGHGKGLKHKKQR